MSNGRTVSQIVEGNRRFDVVMRLSDQDRSTTGLEDLLIVTPSGHVPLRHDRDRPGDRRAQPGAARKRPTPRSPCSANTDGDATWWQSSTDIRAVIARDGLAAGLLHRTGRYVPGAGGGDGSIGLLSLVSLVLIFVVLYSRYQSSVLALIVMGNIPLALIGSVIALNIAGQPLSVASMIGFITLAGISARNGILKVCHYINLALYEGERFGKD